MLLVRTELRESTIHGVGVFAVEPIKAGALVWIEHLGFDIAHPLSEVSKLPSEAREALLKYGHVEGNMLFLCADNARNMNHSDNPTVIVTEDGDFAARDIAAGEELTEDYRMYERGACNEFLFGERHD
jgi:uncharacterized protein